MEKNSRHRLLSHLMVLIIAVIVIPLASCSGNPEEKAASHLKKGEEYMESSHYREAVIEFMNVVKLSPENADGYYKLGLAHLRIGGKAKMQLA